MNDIIEHHGVKGQKWGVRKKRVVAGAAILATVAIAAGAYAYGVKSGHIDAGELTYQLRTALKSPVGSTVKKGTTVTRANRGKMFLDSHSTYFTTKLSDHKKYLTDSTGTNLGKGVMNSVSLKAKTTIKAPSSQKQTREFMKFLKNNPDIVAKSIGERRAGNKYATAEDIVKEASKVKSQMSQMSKSKKSTQLYNQFLDSITEGGKNKGAQATAAKDLFWKQLSDKGYNAVTDQVDKRSGFAKNPMIAFNAQKVFEKVSEVPVGEALKKYWR